jgi:hypothetical protein
LASGTAEIVGTTYLTFTINSDATPALNEDPCVIMKGGDGTRLIEGYMCLITSTGTNDDYFQFRTYADGTPEHTIVHVGPNAATDDIDAYLYLNAGTGAAARQASVVLDGTNDNLRYTATAHEFIGGVTMDNALTVTGTTTLNGALYANGSTTIGSDSSDTLTVTATITSDLLPTDCGYKLGNTSNKWDDGYFCLFTPVHYTPIGSNYSLEGHLKGIDNALALTDVARAVYVITTSEASTDSFDSSRTADQGTAIDLSTVASDADFAKYIQIYWNGQLLYNDAAVALTKGAVQHDVARKSGDTKTLLFSGNLKKNNIIQIVDMRTTA